MPLGSMLIEQLPITETHNNASDYRANGNGLLTLTLTLVH